MTTTPATPPVLALPGVTPALANRLQDGLERVEALLRQVVDHDDPLIAEASAHLTLAGGKRVRPLLTLLAAELGPAGGAPASDDVVAAAAGVELTHLASLYHDDVMDEASVRRGVASANARYDNSTAILVGDLLFGKASEIVADLGPEAVRIQARTFVRLCSGQIRDDRPAPAGADPVGYYLGVLADKTGALIATAARYGAMFGGADERTVSLLTSYGERLGVAFQLADDLIDVASDAEESGKVPGTDLREGKATLPVLHALATTDEGSGRLRALLDPARHEDLRDPALLDEALRLLRAHPALEQAHRDTQEVGREAAALLDGLPESDARTALQTLVISVTDRVG
ncbi:polyprenyl synthetase family protein [Lapillicoccus jejuensis]|uniref:Heptaprenyl diphosphate synthase n=1 Tax=Lapillicoccus jejuensis TaxID=402171 RepID=A0A542DX06_9MICO|nr:polyprenyl synthetase family protein [Lapillicoccus jejuensis]TQJ07630.1 heptaprenyl diphosphate synthase [Lapillicoccus jejuensis]